MKKILLLSILIVISSRFSAAQKDPNSAVYLGIDVVIENDFELFAGKSVALFTNFSGRTREGKFTADVFVETAACKLKAIFTPEHGLYSTTKAGLAVGNDEYRTIPTYSLYGGSKKPSAAQLKGVDCVIVDIRDIGIRAYTYISALYYVMDGCAEHDVPVYVLDAPNPLGGIIVDGPVLDSDLKSYIGIAELPYLHGMTIGEVARYFNRQGKLSAGSDGKPLKCDLQVVEMRGWQRWMQWEDTGLFWTPTSPHIPTPDAVRGAATLGFIGELAVMSVGIGTTSPFQYFGAPGLDGEAFAKYLDEANLRGCLPQYTHYQPFYGMYSGKSVPGFYLKFPLGNDARHFTNGVKILLALRDRRPEVLFEMRIDQKNLQMFKKAIGSEKLYDAIFGDATDEEIIELCSEGIDEFLPKRADALLY